MGKSSNIEGATTASNLAAAKWRQPNLQDAGTEVASAGRMGLKDCVFPVTFLGYHAADQSKSKNG
jgi:hypothetical protein